MSDHPSALSGAFKTPFPEQIAYFRGKLGDLVPTRRWTDMLGVAHDTAFMVAGAASADLLADLAAAVDKAIAEGQGIEAFRKEFKAIVARNGWTGWTGEGTVQGEAWRVKTILRTNAYTSYSAGRHAQLQAGNFAFWVYRHGGSREPRPQHLSWDGLALPPGHAFWQTHYPPSDWGCSCYVVGARTAAGVRRLGGDPAKPLPAGWSAEDPKTGAPVGIGKGWGYAPGASVSDAVRNLARKIEQWPAPIGAEFAAALPEVAQAEISRSFAEFFDEAMSTDARGAAFTVGALKPEWVKSAEQAGVTPASAEIVVRDKDIAHTFRDAKKSQVDPDWFRGLPDHLRQPDAVILDLSRASSPTLLLVFGQGEERTKLVVAIDYQLKKEKSRTNLVRSARPVSLVDIKSQLGKGNLQIIDGDL